MRLRTPAAVLLFVVALLGVALSGCVANDAPPQLLNVLDFAPREAEVGDRLEVIGAGLPEGKAAHVVFKGTLNRPGKKPIKGVEIDVDASSSSADKIEMMFTEGLQTAFCGAGDDAVHTTFNGDVIVSFPAPSPGALPITGSVRGVRIDFRAPTARRAVVQARENEGDRALAYMGITVSDTSPNSGGLLATAVRAASPADRAGVLAGDLITGFEGVRVLSKSDVNPTGASRFAALTLRRAAEGPSGAQGAPATVEESRQISMDGFRPSAPADLLGAGLILLVAAAIIMLFMAPVAGIITWVERRVSARMQSRIGPNRAGPQGFLVWMADGIKSIMKEDIIPTESDQPLFRLAPYLVFLGVSATFCVMPFGQHLIAADLDIGILFVIAVTSLVTIGLMMGGWASNNKWSMLGGIRSAAQIISYEIPGAVAIVCIVMMTGSLRVQDIILAQSGWPWGWFMFKNPITFTLFFLWFTTALAEGNRAPFDLPEAESELVAGYSTEYSGMRYLFFFFAEWANVFVMCGIASALFLGGWQIPGVSPSDQEANFGLQCLGAVVFQLKSWFLIFVVIWIRWTLPRVRIDQMMNLCWKWFVPASFVAFILTGVWVVWSPLQQVQQIIGIGMFAMWMFVVAYFFVRVRYNLKAANVQVHLNPFL
ncbi:MAG TPA: NADH-quinone oxidoreductase subunit NuoH [Polyangiaceae bacterium]|nr:NADH-quinone oxidoreductase subunit NuoH [Polyangiaceae bacterium]